MEQQTSNISSSFISPQEWTRLVRLCATLTSNKDAAEDLAQETMLEAWRHKHELRNAEKRSQWLSGIARNICLRWLRSRGRELAHLTEFEGYTNTSPLEETLVDDYDIEVELERKELVELLDRAMALLSPEMRAVLVKRYVEESSLAEVAAQLGTNTSAVAMRIQRGKLALRRVLTNEMSQEISPYSTYTTNGWEETPLWCYHCGQHHLLGKRNSGEGELLLKCPICSPDADDLISQNHLPILQGIKGYKPLLSRLAIWCNNYYRTGLSNETTLCIGCGRVTLTKLFSPEDMPVGFRGKGYGMSIVCTSCTASYNTLLAPLVLELPEGQQFLQAHPRLRMLPEQYVEINGRETIITRYESISDSTCFMVISALDTYEVLHIHGGHE